MAEDRHDHIDPNLTPAALTLRLIPGPSPADWQVTRHYPEPLQAQVQPLTPQRIPAPWARDTAFFHTLADFWQLSRQGTVDTSERQRLHALAIAVGDQLALVLTDQDRDYLDVSNPKPPFLVIESADPTILALPWELLRLQDWFVVREGHLDVARSIWADAPPLSAPATTPMTLVMTVAAPEPNARDKEIERYRLLRAIPAPVTPLLNETGEFEELLANIRAASSPFGIHFSGQSSDDQLRFEDPSGQARHIPVENLQHAMRKTAPERQPRFFFLALDDDIERPVQPSVARPWLARASVATKLHQMGIAQVVVHNRTQLNHASRLVEPAI